VSAQTVAPGFYESPGLAWCVISMQQLYHDYESEDARKVSLPVLELWHQGHSTRAIVEMKPCTR
jgi:hypothetical protein